MKSIKMKIMLPIFIMFLAFGGLATYLIVGLNANLDMVHEMYNKSYVTLSKAEQLKLDVVQVQQYLTDISATRGESGYDDGLDEAEKSAQDAYKVLDELAEIQPEHSAELDEIHMDINSFYEIGVKMAHEYIVGGPSKGNLMMDEFDGNVVTVNEKVDQFKTNADEDIKLRISEIGTTIEGIKRLIQIVSAAFVLGIAGIWILLTKSIIKPVKNLVSAADKLAYGDVDVEISSSAISKDEIGNLLSSFMMMAENIREKASAASRIADGDLSVEIIPKSEHDVLSISMKAVTDNLGNLVSEMKDLTAAAKKGELNVRGNEDAFQGGFKEIISGVNDTLDGIVDPLNVALDFIEKIANGEEFQRDQNIVYSGKFNELDDNLTMMEATIETLLEEIGKLTKAAADGHLSYRADISRLKGKYAGMVEGINTAFDSVIGPLKITSGYMERIGQGEIPSEITETYFGDFDEIKNSINACIKGLGALIEGNQILYKMSNNDYTERVSGEYLGIYAEISQSINLVSERINNLVGMINQIAIGELEQFNSITESAKRSENDILTPSITTLIKNILQVLEETNTLSNAAIQGKLDVRGDASKLKGDYGKIITGFNDTLDSIIAPIEEAAAVLREMAKGNLHIKMNGAYQGDHAELKTSLNNTLENLSSYVSDISTTLSEISNGNLNLSVTADYKGAFVEIKDSMNNIIITLNQVIGDINDAAEQVNAGARQVSEGSQVLSQGSTEQASAIEELTASIAEIAAQTKQNAMKAGQVSELANNAKENAVSGNDQMKNMLHSMADISEASSNISKVIKVIDDIAFQTNILALNAAVEAARAGQHGKGFAVVAEEVRSLAARSADAAKETTELIEGSIIRVQAGTKIANDTAVALNAIVEGIEQTAGLADEIALASNEQASGIAQINKGVEQVSIVVQNNSATAEESAAASEELSGQSDLLTQMVSRFTLSRSMTDQYSLSGSAQYDKLMLEQTDCIPQIRLSDSDIDKY